MTWTRADCVLYKDFNTGIQVILLIKLVPIESGVSGDFST